MNILCLDDIDGGRINPTRIGYAIEQELDILTVVSDVDMKSKHYKKHMPVIVKRNDDNRYTFFSKIIFS